MVSKRASTTKINQIISNNNITIIKIKATADTPILVPAVYHYELIPFFSKSCKSFFLVLFYKQNCAEKESKV